VNNGESARRPQRHSAGVLFIRIGSEYQPLRHTPSTVSVFSPYPNPPPRASSCAFLLAASPQPLLAVVPFRQNRPRFSRLPLALSTIFSRIARCDEGHCRKLRSKIRLSVRELASSPCFLLAVGSSNGTDDEKRCVVLMMQIAFNRMRKFNSCE